MDQKIKRGSHPTRFVVGVPSSGKGCHVLVGVSSFTHKHTYAHAHTHTHLSRLTWSSDFYLFVLLEVPVDTWGAAVVPRARPPPRHVHGLDPHNLK